MQTGVTFVGVVFLSFFLKVSDWRLQAYSDDSCLTRKIQQRIGAEAFICSTKTAIYVDSGGVGISNITNREDLTGIGPAFRAMQSHSHRQCLFSTSDQETALIS